MKVYFLFLFCLALCQIENIELTNEDQQLLDSVIDTEFGVDMINNIETEFKKDKERKNQLARIEALLNTIEKQIAQDEQNDLEKLSQDQSQYNENIESLKEKIAEAQYDYSSIGAQINTLEDQVNRYETQIKEKENILQDYITVLTQLTQIRQEEHNQFEINRDDSLVICNLIKRARYLIRELLPRNPRNPSFIQQYTYEDNNHQFSSEDVLQQIKELQQEASDTLKENEPFLKIINEFVSVSTQTEAVVDTTKANAIINILQQLYDQVDTTSRSQYNAEDDRENLHQRLLTQVSNDQEYLNHQLQQIKDEQSNIENQICAQQQSQKDGQSRLENLKKQLQDLQKCKEDAKVNFGIRSKERKEQLKLLRKIRKALLNNVEQVQKYIEDLLSRKKIKK